MSEKKKLGNNRTLLKNACFGGNYLNTFEQQTASTTKVKYLQQN